MSADLNLQQEFCIEATHPSLPGHFPGQPVVPGVVLLDRVAACVEQASGRHFATLPVVKFMQPVLPDQTVELSVRMEAAGRVHFTIRRGDAIILTGTGELA